MRGKSLFVIAAIFGCSISSAQINLSHNGTTVDIDETSARTTNWVVNGTDQLFESIWYYRDGDAGTASAVSTISAPVVNLFGTRMAEVIYADNNLTVTITYLLQAAANGLSADLAEQVTVESNFGINLRLFQYNDFDMDGSFLNDTATRLNSSTISQSSNGTSVTNGATSIPDFSELNTFASVRSGITGVAGYNLNSAAGTNIGETMSGDMTYGFQWNANIGDNGAFSASTDKVAAVPEPASMIALGLGAVALLRRRRRQN